MANKKISELTAATAPAETDVMPIVQAAATKKATVSAWVRGALLTGLSTATNAAIAATDSVLVAIGKAQAQITAILSSLNGHIGNTTNAHGMTTPGAAILQAASVADQRVALGLENHEKINVDSAGAALFGGKVSLGGTISQHQYFYPGVGSFNTGYDYSGGRYVISSDGGGTLTAAQRLTIDATSGKLTVFGQLAPGTDNAHSIGNTGERWSTAYLATNPVVGSDARLKCDYSVIPGDIAHELMLKIVPRVGKFIVGGQESYKVEEVTTNEAGEEVTRKVTRYREVPGNRYHTYYLAQEVKAALDAVADRWPQAANLALWLLSDVEDVDSTQMIRYEQMIPIIHAATVYQWQQK